MRGCLIYMRHKCMNKNIDLHMPCVLSLNWGWTGKDGSPSPTLGTIIEKSYYGRNILSSSLGSKTLNTTSLGLGGTKIKDLVVGTTWLVFSPPRLMPSDFTHLHFPRVCSPNNGKVGIKSFTHTPGASGLILM